MSTGDFGNNSDKIITVTDDLGREVVILAMVKTVGTSDSGSARYVVYLDALIELKTDPAYQEIAAVVSGNIYTVMPDTSSKTNHGTSFVPTPILLE